MSSSLEWRDKPVKYLRDKVVDQLKYSFAHDHLETDEFDQLVRLALNTQSKTELLSLVSDLPVKTADDLVTQERDLAILEESESITNILSESKRIGIWTPPKYLKVLNVLGDSQIDFRDVQLERELFYISLTCCLGNVKLIIPPDVNVVVKLKGILSSIDGNSHRRLDPESPTIVIEGKVILGDVKIIVKE